MKAKKFIFASCLSMVSFIGMAQVTEYTVTSTGEKIIIDPTEQIYSATPNYTESGRTVVNNQEVYFGWFLTTGKEETVQARWSFWQGEKLVMLGAVLQFNIKPDGNNGRRIPAYVGNIPAGTYQIKPLILRADYSHWVIPKDRSDYEGNRPDRFSYKNWEYNIEDINTHKAPSVVLLCSEGLSDELVGGNGIPTLFNLPEERHRYERFDAFVRFSNKTNHVKKGKIRLMYERDFDKFWKGYVKSNAENQLHFSASITKGATMNGFTDWDDNGLPVEIPANTKDLRFDIKGCYANEYFDWGGKTYTPFAHVYFQPEGSTEWILCGVDAAGDFDASHNLIPSVYQKNCNNFALWITDATDSSVAADKFTLTYNSTAKTVVVSGVPNRSYAFLYNMDGKTVKAESTVKDGNYTISTAGIASGAYLLKIISGTAVKTIKLNL